MSQLEFINILFIVIATLILIIVCTVIVLVALKFELERAYKVVDFYKANSKLFSKFRHDAEKKYEEQLYFAQRLSAELHHYYDREGRFENKLWQDMDSVYMKLNAEINYDPEMFLNYTNVVPEEEIEKRLLTFMIKEIRKQKLFTMETLQVPRPSNYHMRSQRISRMTLYIKKPKDEK